MSPNTASQMTFDPGRRRFLTSTGAGILAAGMSTAAGTWALAETIGEPVSKTAAAQDGQPQVPSPPSERVGFAIVGLGKLAVEQLLPAFKLTKYCRPTALVSGSVSKAKAIAKVYGIDEKSCYTYLTFDQLRNNPNVQVIFIVLPNSMHMEYTVRGAQAGKHILCEKPMATNSADCRTMIAACKSAGTKLMIAYRCHYEPYNRRMIDMCRAKEFGPIQLIVSDTVQDAGGPGQWRMDPALSGGGSLFDIGIYSLNAARYLTGEEPIEVNAMIWSDKTQERFQKIEQTIAFQLRFASGAMANCTSSHGVAPTNRYRVIGTKGYGELMPATSYHGQRMFRGTEATREEINLVPADQFASEMDHFAECVMQNKESATPGEEGLRDVALIEKIYEAANNGRTVRIV